MKSFRMIGSSAAKALALSLTLTVPCGCGTVGRISGEVGQATGLMTKEQSNALVRSADAVEKTFQDITPEQEYYIGRSVAATVLTTYKPFDREQANAYLNLLGQTVAQFSAKPEVFGGYHFLLLDSDEVNAFAAPGGLILISRGMVRCCKSEDELVAVLAHEISHVDHQHGLKAIRKGRLTTALTTIGSEAGKSLGGAELAQVTAAFEDSIGDITSTLVNRGYSRATEYEADKGAVAIMTRMGYDPAALITMLGRMEQQLQGGLGFAKTHPAPQARVAEVKKLVGGVAPASSGQTVRQERFQAAMGSI